MVSGERAKTHGNYIDNHENIARLWSAYLNSEIRPDQVAAMMALLKLARTMTGTFNRDDYDDAASYIGIAGALDARRQP